MAHVIDAVLQLRDNFSGTIQQASRNMSQFSRQTIRTGRDIQKTGRDVERIGSNLTRRVTLPIMGIGIAAAKVGMDFEASMSNVKALSGASGKEMEQLEKAARDAGAATSKSAKEAADALGYMSLAGWDVQDSIKGLMPVLRLSEAGNIDLAHASDLVTDSMSAMGLTTDELTEYLDIVAQTARSSNTDIDQMLESYIKVGGTMRGLKVPIEDSALALGMLANAGIKGSESGKALNAIMINLTAPTGRAQKALKELNFTAFDAQGNFKGMEKVLFELKDKMSGMTDEQKNMYLSMIGGKEHVKDLNALLNGLDDSYKSLSGDIAEAEGALNEMSEEMLRNNKGSITALSSALQELGLKIYDNLKPMIADAVDFLRKLTKTLDETDPKTQQAIIKVAMFAAALGPAILIIGKLTTGIGKTVLKVGNFSKEIKKAGSLTGALFTPGNKVVLILAALAIGAILLYTNWDKLKAATQAVKEKFQEFRDKLEENKGTIETVATVLGVVFGPAIVKSGVQAVAAGKRITISFVGSLIKTSIEVGKTALAITGQLVASMAKSGLEAIKTAGIFTGRLIVAMVRYAMSGWRAVAAIGATVLAWGIQKGAMIASTAVTGVMTAAQWALNAAMLAAPYMWIVLLILAVVAAGIALYRNWDVIKAKAGEVWGSIKTTIGGFVTSTIEKFEAFKTRIKNIWDSIRTFLRNPIKGTVNLVENVVKNSGKKPKKHATGLRYVPYDNYPALLHRGERVLTRSEASQQHAGAGNITIAKLADTIIVREEADIDKVANALVEKITRTEVAYGGVW